MFETYFIIISAFIATSLAQIVKPLFGIRKYKKLDLTLVFASGRFPSSHSAGVCALVTSVALMEGFSSTYFAIALVFAVIVMYDAMNVRYYAGKNISLTQQIIKDLLHHDFKLDDPIYVENIKQILGHERLEVFGGLVCGILVSLSLYFFVY